MRMWEGSGRLVNTLGPSDQHVPGSVELMTLRARSPHARARLVPATSAAQPAADGYHHDGESRETQSCRAEATSYPLDLRFPGPGSAAMRAAVHSGPQQCRPHAGALSGSAEWGNWQGA